MNIQEWFCQWKYPFLGSSLVIVDVMRNRVSTSEERDGRFPSSPFANKDLKKGWLV